MESAVNITGVRTLITVGSLGSITIMQIDNEKVNRIWLPKSERNALAELIKVKEEENDKHK